MNLDNPAPAPVPVNPASVVPYMAVLGGDMAGTGEIRGY